LFQVIAGRAERAAVIVTTNLPFSEWTTMLLMAVSEGAIVAEPVVTRPPLVDGGDWTRGSAK
jgi:DNA replication protein DnaC